MLVARRAAMALRPGAVLNIGFGISDGVPVVAADLPGFRSVVADVGCGELVDPTSPPAIAAGIRRLLELGPEGLRAVGDKGLAAAHDRFNWEVQAEVLEGIYADLLARDGSA